MKIYLEKDNKESIFEVDGIQMQNPLIEKYEDKYESKSEYSDAAGMLIVFKDCQAIPDFANIIKENIKEHDESRQKFENLINSHADNDKSIIIPIRYLDGIIMTMAFENLVDAGI